MNLNHKLFYGFQRNLDKIDTVSKKQTGKIIQNNKQDKKRELCMLLKLRFKNYKSFQDEAILDLQAADLEEYTDQVRLCGKEKVLPVAAVYGANGSGKSNIIDAFRFMSDYVRNCMNYEDSTNELTEEDTRAPVIKPFIFGKEEDLENLVSEFEVWFTTAGDTDGRVFNYGFSLSRSGVEEEWMNYKTKSSRTFKPVFYREKDEITYSSKIPRTPQKFLSTAINNRRLIATVGKRLGIEYPKIALDWFNDAITVNAQILQAQRSSLWLALN